MMIRRGIVLVLLLSPGLAGAAGAAMDGGATVPPFPPSLESYGDGASGLWEKIAGRARAEPLNLVATLLFFLAVIHTFLAPRFMHLAHRWRDEHQQRLEERRKAGEPGRANKVEEVSFKAEAMHFLGEIEAVFGLWVVPLLGMFLVLKDWPTAEHYLSNVVQYTEPMFVVVVMTIAATRPVMIAAERLMTAVARLAGGGPAAAWFVILTVGPLLGSFITEPAAMTISALLLSRRFYDARPNRTFAYATLGLLFVNVSVGGTITHFAAPPVLMVAGRWGWGTEYMALHFGWKAALAILAANFLYWALFRRQFARLQPVEAREEPRDPVPMGITVIHLFFLGWTVFTAHHPALFVGGYLFFLAFAAATEHHQSPIVLRPALLVGFFLAGLVIHGGLQGWWIAPVIESMAATPLFFAAIGLTAFNDNAAITFLASLVPNLSDAMKYAVVAGAVTGGGLTVIANAPNPAGQSILSKHFGDGISPLGLLAGALPPTAIAAAFFLLFR